MIESLFDLLSRNRCAIFFLIPLSPFLPPQNEQKTAEGRAQREALGCECPAQLDRGQHQRLGFYGDRKMRLVRSRANEVTLSLKHWKKITCWPCSLLLTIGKTQNSSLFCGLCEL